MTRNTDNKFNNEVLYNDVLLLDRILRGEWKGTYKGYSKDNIDRVIIYAEFDMEYKYVHSRIVNGCYISKDEKNGKDIVLSYDEYMETIKSLTETNIIHIGSGDDKPKKKGYINSPLKNKVNTAFQILYHIIDGAQLDGWGYTEYENTPEPKAPENGTKLDYKIYEIQLEEWRDEQNRLLRKRESVIKKEIVGKGSDRKIFYKYLQPMEDYIEEHFRQKNVKNILNTSAKESITRKSEIVDALVSDLNQDLVQKIRQIEKEIDDELHPDSNVTLVGNLQEKYKTALRLAMKLGDPNEMSSLLVCYLDYTNQANVKSYYDNNEPLKRDGDEKSFINECIAVIQKNATKSLEDIERAARGIGSEWLERLDKGFENQIMILRKTNSRFLAEVLFVYAKICMSVYDFDKALDCFEKCRDIYRKSETPKAISSLITIYTNLAKLHSDWNHCEEALDNAKLSIECMKKIELSVLNKTDVSFFYATIYNTMANAYLKQNNYDEAEQYLNKAYQTILKENDEDPNIFALQLMINYNLCALDIKREEYDKAAAGLDLVLSKAMLLYAIDKTEDNMVFKLTVQSALARALKKTGNLEDAEYYAIDALKDLQKLYEKNQPKYAVDRLTYMSLIADIYDEKGNDSESENLYLKVRKDAYNLIDSGVSIAKTVLYDILTNLAGLYNKTEMYDKAIDVTEESLDLCDELLSLNAEYYIMEIIKTLNNLSIANYKNGNIEEAIKLCQEATDTCEGLMDEGYSNPDMLNHYYYKILHDYSIIIANFNE